MNKFDKKKLIFIKKLIGLSSCILCIALMAINFISYTSSSSLNNGDSVVLDDKFSLFSFLFNKNCIVLDSKVLFLRNIFKFSYVIMWISFILTLSSIVVAIIGIAAKKTVLSKIGNYILTFGVIILSLMFFDRYSIGNTVKFLNIFTWQYGLIILVNLIGLYSTMTIYERKRS